MAAALWNTRASRRALRGSIAIIDAHVLTMDPAHPHARAVVIHDGIIEHVGTSEAARSMDRGVDMRIDAKGRTLIPGFNDAHGHFIHEGLMADRLDLTGSKDLTEVYHRIRDYAQAHPEKEVIVAERWDDGAWPQPGFPTREGLDAVVRDRPVLARRVDGHVAVANRALLDVYRERWDGPRDGIAEESGLLLEEPSLNFNLILPPSPKDLDAGIARFIAKARREGVTSGQDFANPIYFRAWQRHVRRALRRSETPGIRIAASTYLEHLDDVAGAGLETGTGSDWLRAGGVKIFADGSIGGRTANLKEPYLDDGGRGTALFTDDELAAHVHRAHEAGIQVRMHVIGDGAAEQGTRAFEALAESAGLDAVRAMRHRFEHYEMSDEGMRRRAKSLGLVLSMQPNFVGAWSNADGLYGRRLGPRHRDMNPIAKILREGLPVAFGSDCMPFGPLHGLRGVLGAPYEEMRPSIEQALAAYTIGSAYGEHEEHRKGMLRRGMLGDAVLLSGDLAAPGTSGPLTGVEVDITVLDGTAVYDKGTE